MTLEELIYEKEKALARAEAADKDWDDAKAAQDQPKVESAKQVMSDELDRYDEYNRQVVAIRAGIRERARRDVDAARAAAEADYLREAIEENFAPNRDVDAPKVPSLFSTLGPARTAELLRAKLRSL